MEIYVTSHDRPEVIRLDYLKPLHVGAAGRETMDGFQRDDEGDNISDKNFCYNELTGLYWIWKNTTSSVVGLCHYRRYFSPYELHEGVFFSSPLADIAPLLAGDPAGHCLDITGVDIDIVIPRRYSLGTFIDRSHIENTKTPLNSVWFVALNALYNTHKDEFYEARDFFSSKSFLYPCNMFIAKRPVINEYCEWLFPILFEFERLMAGYPREEMKRSCAYLGEMLFTWWVCSRPLKVATRPVFFITDLYSAPRT